MKILEGFGIALLFFSIFLMEGLIIFKEAGPPFWYYLAILAFSAWLSVFCLKTREKTKARNKEKQEKGQQPAKYTWLDGLIDWA